MAPWPGRATLCSALAALVFCSRAWLIRAGGSPVPFWDQWDAEALGLYLPWLHGTFRWADLLQAHNEHRIVCTRLADLALFVARGGWDPWTELLLNAALHAATAAGLAGIFWPATTARNRPVLVLGLAVLFTSTCGWQNALWGFQSQFYFANLFTVAAIAGLCLGPPARAGWWLGLGAAGLALFTTGGGLLAAAAILAASLGARWRATPTVRPWWADALVAAVLLAGIALRPTAAGHDPLHAKSLAQFLAVWTRCLAWPWVDSGFLGLVMPLPLVGLVTVRWRQRVALDGPERCALALGLFAVLHAAAVAYSRGAGLLDARPLSRYQDPLLLGVAAQLFAALRLGAGAGRVRRIALLLWGGLALAGLIGLTETNLTLNLPYKRSQDGASLAMIRAYVATGDAAVFTRDARFAGPHPDPHVVQRVLDDPALRAILPPTLLAAPDDPAGPPPRVIQHGPALTAVSGALLLILVAWRRRADSATPGGA
jgi:hypothetical protein